MNLRTRLSRSNGYRELGMFDQSILELEAIEFVEGSVASLGDCASHIGFRFGFQHQ